MDISTRIGSSTLIAGAGGANAIISIVDSIRAAGFKAIEICPVQATSVDPLMNPAFIDTLFNEAERRTIRAALRSFHVVTVPTSSHWVTTLRGQTTEDALWAPYHELMRFAHDIGADLVSFHPLQRTGDAALSYDEMVEYNVTCGQRAVEYADEWKTTAAFEKTPPNGGWSRIDALHEIVSRINSERFGLLCDIGHVALNYGASSGRLTRHILRALERCGDRILQLHVHGVQRTKDFTKLRDHRPLTERNVVDLSPIKGALKTQSFHGPLIFEIYYPDTGELSAPFPGNLQACVSAKQELLKH